MAELKTALTIAGSDSSGGAGIQADIKTMTANGVYAMSAITALTAQNTMGVSEIFNVSPRFLKSQIDAVFCDIRPNAVKIGMVPTSELIDVITKSLTEYETENVVVDPVMIATSGARLIKSDAVSDMCEKLFPIAAVITPNIPEAETISGIKIADKSDMERVAGGIYEKYGCAVLLKGGHSRENADDLLCSNGKYEWFSGEKIDNPNTHGTGCTLSSAIASNLAKGYSLTDSVRNAKEYITGALKAMLKLGNGSGPLNHMYNIR